MRNVLKLLWIIALAAVIGFTVMGCTTDDDGGNNSGNNNSGGNNNGSGTTLSAPTGVTATALSSSEIKISWNTVNGAASYKVYFAESSSGQYELDGTSTTTSFTSVDWRAGRTGYFKVTAVNSAGVESDYSSIVSATTQSSGGNNNSGNNNGGTTGNSSITITVTGYRQYTSSTIGLWVLSSNPSTFETFEMAIDNDSSSYSREVSFVGNPNSTNIYEMSNFGWGITSLPDGTYTIIVSTGGIGFSLSSTQVYKFPNVTISGGKATVPFNEVVGSSIGSNGRLK